MNYRPQLINGKYVVPPEYRAWKAMKTRCLNPRATNYARYGGRGIRICSRWMNFDEFLADMGPRPTRRHTLERSNGNSHYMPGNVVWATYTEQNRNHRGCKLSKHRVAYARRLLSEGQTQKKVAMRLGVSPSLISLLSLGHIWKD